jgi:single-strand DNA-binding protein
MNGAMVAFVGTLGRDPELRFTTGGRAVANFSIAVSRRWQKNGEWEEQTSWFNIVCWGDLGENVATSLTKGSRVIVSGRMEQRSYETQEGEKRTVYDIIADEVGPSLRWATTIIERTERTTGDQSGGSYHSNEARAAQNSGDAPRDDKYTYSEEEEPF